MGRVVPSLRGVFCVQRGWLDVCGQKQLLLYVSSSVGEDKMVSPVCVGEEGLRVGVIVVGVVGDLCHGPLLLFTCRGGTLGDKAQKQKNVAVATLHCPKSWIEGLDHGHVSPAPGLTSGRRVAVRLEILNCRVV